jgi:mRNA-degrading endonuclease RelE of RelBE toxin-antitoxin system
VALKGAPTGNYRLRVGDHRMGYAVDDEARTVTVWLIAARKRFYQQMRRRRP